MRVVAGGDSLNQRSEAQLRLSAPASPAISAIAPGREKKASPRIASSASQPVDKVVFAEEDVDAIAGMLSAVTKLTFFIPATYKHLDRSNADKPMNANALLSN